MNAGKTRISRTMLTDGVVLALWFLASGVYCWKRNPPWILANSLLMGVPLGYLLLRSPRVRSIRVKFVTKIIVFGDVTLLYLCERYGGWYASTALPFRLPGAAVVEEIQFTALYVPLVIAVNERFFADGSLSPRKSMARTVLLILLWFTVAVALIPPLHFFIRDYVYFKLWCLLYLVIPIAAWVSPRFIREGLALCFVFAGLNLFFEILALKNNYWGFRGQYLSTVVTFGYRFPIEEFLFYVLLSAPAVSAVYTIYKNWRQIGGPAFTG